MSYREVNLTISGNPVTGIALNASETTVLECQCLDEASLTPLDLDGTTQTLSIAQIDLQGNPISPAILCVAGVPGVGIGVVDFTILSSDTVALLPDTYFFTVVITQVSDGTRLVLLPTSRLAIVGVATC